MSDYLVRGIGFNDQVRIFACRTEDTLNHIGKKLNYFPSALDAVGRVLNVGVMMGSMLKLEETVTVKVDGDGPIGLIMAEADAHGHVRAYASNPHCHFEYNSANKLNVRETVGHTGLINVIKDLKLKEPFIGSVPIIDGELAKDFAYYLMISEQVPSVVSLGVLVNTNNLAKSAGGFIIQLLPNTKEEVIAAIEKKLNTLPTVSEMFQNGMSLEQIGKMLSDDTFEVVETTPVRFRCTCSKSRFSKGIISLGKDEIQDMIDKDHGANTVCHFCGKNYEFSEEELVKLHKKAK